MPIQQVKQSPLHNNLSRQYLFCSEPMPDELALPENIKVLKVVFYFRQSLYCDNKKVVLT